MGKPNIVANPRLLYIPEIINGISIQMNTVAKIDVYIAVHEHVVLAGIIESGIAVQDGIIVLEADISGKSFDVFTNQNFIVIDDVGIE
jgi:hypothetical protein